MLIKNKLQFKETLITSKKCYMYFLLVLSVGLFIVTLLTVGLIEAKAEQNDSKEYLSETTDLSKRPTRETGNSTSREAKTGYYEEQRPVVVNAESSVPSLAQDQNNFSPLNAYGESYDQNPYYEETGADEYDNGPYEQSDYQQQQYMGEQNYRSQESSEIQSEESANRFAEGRGAQDSQYDSYYGQWRVGTTPNRASNADNRKIPSVNRMTQNLSPYTYNGDPGLREYNYPLEEPAPYHPLPTHNPMPSTPSNSVEQSENSGSTILTVIRSLKQMWDIYQALASAWNAIYEHQQKQTELLQKQQKEKLKEVKKSRINSRKPTDKEAVKNPRQKSNATTTAASEKSVQITDVVLGKVEPRKNKLDKTIRKQRNSDSDSSTDVAEGRYIKGDPLKGYYDFVITEGSYKFWAVFQVGTAILIIYSTFAAIYYSKVNPLVGDYDYTDYLGGARSLSGGDMDFEDDSDSTTSTQSKASFSDWLPKTTHSLKFILDAIDKLPVDHDI